MRDFAKNLAWQLVPGYMADRAIRWNADAQRRNAPQSPVGEVEAGPFAGLTYPEPIADSVVAADLKRAGRYEEALVPVVAAELDRKPTEFVDVGAAEGFYAVSGALRGVKTIAYESSSIQRNALRQLADANGAEVEIRRHCRRLPEIAAGGLLLMDVEGAEAQLLGGDAAERLRACTVIVELHDFIVPGVGETLSAAFEATHHTETVSGDPEPGRQGGKPIWAIFRPRRNG